VIVGGFVAVMLVLMAAPNRNKGGFAD